MSYSKAARGVAIAILLLADYNGAFRQDALLAMCDYAELCSLLKFSEAK